MGRKPIGENKLSNAEKHTIKKEKIKQKEDWKISYGSKSNMKALYKNPEKQKEYFKRKKIWLKGNEKMH